MITLPVAAGRNLAVLTEAAVRTHMLRAKGVDPAAAFIARHSALPRTRRRRERAARPARRLLIVVSGMSGSRQDGRAEHARGPRLLLRRQPAGGTAAASSCAASAQPGARSAQLAVGIDVRNRPATSRSFPEWLSAVGALGPRSEARVLRHPRRRAAQALLRHPPPPSADPPRAGAGRRDRARAAGAAAAARARRPLIDTSDLNVHQLRRRVITELGTGGGFALSLLFESFAYKRGVPPDADFVFDARALPNPHWDARLRPLSGRDAAVRELPRRAGRRARICRPGRRPSSTPGCRASIGAPAATSRSRSAAPAAAIARCTWPRSSPSTRASAAGARWRRFTASSDLKRHFLFRDPDRAQGRSQGDAAHAHSGRIRSMAASDGTPCRSIRNTM